MRASRVAGLSGASHKLRHTFATLFRANGGDVVSLQRILGHTSVRMSERYLDVDGLALQEAQRRFSPVARRYAAAHDLPVTVAVQLRNQAQLEELTAWLGSRGISLELAAALPRPAELRERYISRSR